MAINANIVILIFMILAALWTVMTRSLLRSAIGLALTSAIVSVLMFRLDASLAAVFELSVCTGLISVLFISTISLTEPLTREEVIGHMKARFKRFIILPVIIAIAGIILSFITVRMNLSLPLPESETNVRSVLWDLRRLDMVGQVIILLAGVFGIVVLFKESNKK